jgi:hypothetical protein
MTAYFGHRLVIVNVAPPTRRASYPAVHTCRVSAPRYDW